jgi:hypothetical protein
MTNIITLLAQGLCWEQGGDDWDKLGPVRREKWLGEARAAIAALGLSKPEVEELEAYRSAAIYSPTMSGAFPFKGWNGSQLERARELTQANELMDIRRNRKL